MIGSIMKIENSNIELTKMVNKLIDIIGKEIKLLETYLELLDRQQECTLSGDRDKLEQINADQIEKLDESRLYNRERIELIKQIKEINAYDKNPEVDRLIELIEKERADRLLKLRETFVTLNDKIEETRNNSDRLVERSRLAIMKTLDMLSRIYCPESFADDKNAMKANMNFNKTANAAVNLET